MKEFEVSRRTVARDLDFLRDEERAPLAYDGARHGFRLTDVGQCCLVPADFWFRNLCSAQRTDGDAIRIYVYCESRDGFDKIRRNE
jgi:hypothetical protein